MTHKNIHEILQITDLKEFENECEKYRDVLLETPTTIT